MTGPEKDPELVPKKWVVRLIDAIRTATEELTRFLQAEMPKLSDDWWQKYVVDRLSFQQQRTVEELGVASLFDS